MSLTRCCWLQVYYSIFQGYLINYATTMAIVSAVWGSIMAFSQVNHHVVIKRAAIAAKAAAAKKTKTAIGDDGPAGDAKRALGSANSQAALAIAQAVANEQGRALSAGPFYREAA